jgi:hypothetical protein
MESDRKTHVLKTIQPFFDLVIGGFKTFEVRKNDRDYKENDLVIFREWKDGEFTGYCTEAKTIIYVLKHEDFPDGIMPGYCVFGFET